MLEVLEKVMDPMLCIPSLRTTNEKQESRWMLASLPPQAKLDRIRPEETKPKQTDKAGNKLFT